MDCLKFHMEKPQAAKNWHKILAMLKLAERWEMLIAKTPSVSLFLAIALLEKMELQLDMPTV
ncbi:MAG: hypothetical protein ACJAW3_001369 [Lentimonas sp.]|jgi:hypothetical protein